MINEKAVVLLEQIIKDKYKNVKLDNKVFNEEEFYYEFKIDEKISENDFELLEKLVKNLERPVFLEGRVWSPDDVKRAFEIGAYAVVIGSAITRPHLITRRFVEVL